MLNTNTLHQAMDGHRYWLGQIGQVNQTITLDKLYQQERPRSAIGYNKKMELIKAIRAQPSSGLNKQELSILLDVRRGQGQHLEDEKSQLLYHLKKPCAF